MRTLAVVAAALFGFAGPALADDVHVVQPGETLWQIAANLSGNPHRWPELYRANRDQIKDPSLLYPGQRLAIPEGVRERVPGVSEAPPPERATGVSEAPPPERAD